VYNLSISNILQKRWNIRVTVQILLFPCKSFLVAYNITILELAILEGRFLINVLTHDIWLKFDFLSKRRSKNAFSGNVLKNWQKYLHTTLTTCIISYTSHTPVFDVNATTVERVHRVHRQGRNLPHKAESPPLVQNQPFHSTSPKYQLVYPLPSQRICPHTCMVQT
jgi:hypothetical protein